MGLTVSVSTITPSLTIPRPSRLNPNDAKAYSGRAIVYGDRGDLDKAVADFTESIRLYSTLPEVRYNRGKAYLQKADPDKAIADFTQSISLDPRHADTYENRGSAYSLKGDLNKAISDFTQAIAVIRKRPRRISNVESPTGGKGKMKRRLPTSPARLPQPNVRTRV